jgi:hypothetical protein
MKPLLLMGIVILMTATINNGDARANTQYSDEQIANAIYKAEGGRKTLHPYGILKKYKHTTARQACINTIRHARRDWNGRGDFIAFLGSRYCPTTAHLLNRFWVSNVKYFLAREA